MLREFLCFPNEEEQKRQRESKKKYELQKDEMTAN